MRNCAIALASGLAAVALPIDHVVAQESASNALEEVVVTARKREETQQDVPISITAFTAEKIENLGIESVYDVAKLTPNLSFNQTYGRVFDRPVIRGQSQLLGERTVSFVIDGIYVAGNITGADLDDLEQIEVLKGPQAVNYGRGSLAGVISYRTKRPSDDWRMKFSASVGDDRYEEGTANISGPIIADKLSFKLGGRYYEYGGQYTARSSDGRTVPLGEESTRRVSGALLYTPTDNLDFMLRAYAGRNKDGLYNNSISKTLNCFTTTGAQARGGSFCGELPTVAQDGGLAVDLRDIERQGRPGVDVVTNLYSAESNWSIGPVKVTGLVSWGRQDEDWIVDDFLINGATSANASVIPSATMTIANPGNITRLITVREYRSQELRIASTGDGKLQWLLGAYHYDQENTGFNGGPRYNVLAMGVPAATNTGPVGTLREISQPISPFKINNQAVFGAVYFDPSDRWHFALEGRYAKDELETNNTVQAVTGPNPLGRGTFCAPILNEEFSSFSPRGSVRFDFSEYKNVYLSVARGSKPGDFNNGLCSANFSLAEAQRLAGITPLAVEEEEATNYELGSKMRFLNGRMSLDMAVFFLEWDNQQVTGSQVATNAVTNQPINVSLTTNATSEARGLELNWRYRLNDNWDFNLGYGFAEVEFDQFCDPTYAQILGVLTRVAPCSDPLAAVGVSVEGFRSANAPDHTGNVGVEYTTLVWGDRKLSARLDGNYQGERFAEIYNHASTGASTRLDARVSLEFDAWKVTAWGRNLGNERKPDSVVRFFDPDSGFAFTRAYQVHYPNGRQLGLTATYSFGGN
jgi:outer membrane receptor protein involved in Fe transport